MPARATTSFADVPASHWASAAVRYTAIDRDWMATGSSSFSPLAPTKRREWARALVKAFAPRDAADPALTFHDITQDDPDFTFVAVAVKRGWIPAPNGIAAPEAAVTKSLLARGLVLALGLRAEVTALSRIAAGGVAIPHRSDFAHLVIAAQLRLHRNHPVGSEGADLLPASPVPRADAAWSLWRAFAARGTWLITEVARYRSIALPAMDERTRAVVSYAFSYAGWPYVYAGEWFRPTPDGYCCGAQPQGGFDCSGWAWWMLRAPGSGWDNTAFRPYRGWSLPERSSSAMAKATRTRIALTRLRPLDLVFFDSDSTTSDGTDWSSVDHAGVALGNGWMIHSSGGRAAVTIDWIGDGWWAKHFRWGRRIVV